MSEVWWFRVRIRIAMRKRISTETLIWYWARLKVGVSAGRRIHRLRWP